MIATSNVCSGMTGQWSDRSAMSSCKTLSPPGSMSYWGSGPHSEGEGSAGIDMSKSPMVQSTAFDIQADGKLGPGRPKMAWKQLIERECREGKLSAIPSWETYLEVWCEICHACSKLATWQGTHWCGCWPCTYTLIKNPMMMMMMMMIMMIMIIGKT